MFSTLALLLIFSACSTDEPAARAPKVLVIGIDGLRADQIDATPTPNLDQLAGAGARTLTATNCWTADKAWNGHSATNWGTLLTGRLPDVHGATANGVRDHHIGRDRDGLQIDSFLGMVKDVNPALRTAVVNTWPGIRGEDWTLLGQDTSVCDWWFHPTEEVDGKNRDTVGMEALAARLSGADGPGPDVSFLHIDGVDGAGHEHGYDSAQYRKTLAEVDLALGPMLDAIAARPQRNQERWLVLLTTDHGGAGTGHGDNSQPEVHTIPFIVRADGKVLPLDGASLYDVAPTVLAWMGGDPAALELRGTARAVAP